MISSKKEKLKGEIMKAVFLECEYYAIWVLIRKDLSTPSAELGINLRHSTLVSVKYAVAPYKPTDSDCFG